MDDARVLEMIAMFQAGIPVAAIAEELQVSSQTAYRILKAQDQDVGKMRKDPDVLEVIDDYLDTEIPVKDVCRNHRISTDALYTILTTYEIERRRYTKEKVYKYKKDAAVEMYQAGWVYREIKAETGVSPPSLRDELTKRGIPLRSERE